jgi:hypothetical protein
MKKLIFEDSETINLNELNGSHFIIAKEVYHIKAIIAWKNDGWYAYGREEMAFERFNKVEKILKDDYFKGCTFYVYEH